MNEDELVEALEWAQKWERENASVATVSRALLDAARLIRENSDACPCGAIQRYVLAYGWVSGKHELTCERPVGMWVRASERAGL